MAVNAILEVEEVEQLLRSLLEKGLVDALLAPQSLPAGDSVVQTLVQDPARLESLNIFAPVIPVSSATLLSRLTVTGFGGRVGAVLRSCEMRAFIELVKLQQARREDVFIIGIDCLGTYEVADYARLVREGNRPAKDVVAGARGENFIPRPGYALRTACRMCERPFPENADLTIGFVGLEGQILISASDDVAENLSLTPNEIPQSRREVMARVVAERTQERDRIFSEFRERVRDLPSLLAEFSTCIRCYNCMIACPICYCKECIFRTDTLNHPPAQYRRWAGRKGLIRMPTDTLLFHLTRLSHMVTSCVGCGMCASACPSRLPVDVVFRAVGERVQALFDYVPGRNLEEEIPLAAFREDELKDLGERR